MPACFDHDRAEVIRERLYQLRAIKPDQVLWLLDEMERLADQLDSMRAHARGLAAQVAFCKRHHFCKKGAP